MLVHTDYKKNENMKIKGKINGEKMGGNGWGGTWGLGLVGTRELKKKICRCILYTRPPSPSFGGWDGAKNTLSMT